LSFFASHIGKMVAGYGVTKGASIVGDYFKENIFKGSFLETSFEKYIKPYDPFGISTEQVRNASGRLVEGATKTGAELLLGQGLGVDPKTMKNMPDIDVPDRNTYSSKFKNFQKGSYRPPQGSIRIIDNAMKDPVVKKFAFSFAQSKMPRIQVAKPTLGLGTQTISGMDKGVIRASKIKLS